MALDKLNLALEINPLNTKLYNSKGILLAEMSMSKEAL